MNNQDYIIKEIPINLVRFPDKKLVYLETDITIQEKNRSTLQSLNISKCEIQPNHGSFITEKPLEKHSNTFNDLKAKDVAREFNEKYSEQKNSKEKLFQNDIMDSITLQSLQLTNNFRYQYGIISFKDNQACLVPVQNSYRLAPTLPFLNKVSNKLKKNSLNPTKSSNEINTDDTEAESEQITVCFSIDENEKPKANTNTTKLTLEQNINVNLYDLNSEIAEIERENLIRKSSPQPINDQKSFTFVNYAEKLFPFQNVNTEYEDLDNCVEDPANVFQ